MAIPDFQTLMLPLLELLKNGKPIKLSEMVEKMSDKYNLTDEERNEWLPSKRQKTMYNRVAWAKQYLKDYELIESPEKGSFKITKKGVNILKSKPKNINLKFLKDLDGKNQPKADSELQETHIEENKTPEELIGNAQSLYNESLKKELLTKLKKVDAIRFEKIVIELMEKMGYGSGSMTPRSHDGGIDGYGYHTDDDDFRTTRVVIQCKRYNSGAVSEPEINQFLGAMNKFQADYGVFITNSRFTNAARIAAREGTPITLIDGNDLIRLIIRYELFITPVTTYVLDDFYSEN